MSEVIKLTEETVTMYADMPQGIGSKIDLEVKLPEGVLLESFRIHGTITGCQYVKHNGMGNYMIHVSLGDMTPMNKKILKAYVDFLERDKMLKAIKIDFRAFQEAFTDFGKKLKQLGATAEEMKTNLTGILELMMRNAEGKTTLH